MRESLIAYPDDDIRLPVQRAVAIETPRGWRIAKDKTAHKIDVVIALGMAALGAVQGGIGHHPLNFTEQDVIAASRPPSPAMSRFSRPMRFDRGRRAPTDGFSQEALGLCQPGTATHINST